MIRVATLLFLLLIGTALAYGASITLLHPQAAHRSPASTASSQAGPATLLSGSWLTIKSMFR